MFRNKSESFRDRLYLLREYVTNQKQNVRNMDVEHLSGEISDGNEEHAVGNCKKGDPCYKIAKNLA